MGILSIEPHKELDLDQQMQRVSFYRDRDMPYAGGTTIVYNWKYSDAFGLSITCVFWSGLGRVALERIVVKARPDFAAGWSAQKHNVFLENHEAINQIRAFVLKQTDGIIDIFKNYE